jgi:sulfane dehydrogenase subunit SoxC
MRRQQPGAQRAEDRLPLGMAAIHGVFSCAEWTGVKLSTLLDEAGVDPAARWVIAEGADAAAMSRSIPRRKGAGRRARVPVPERRARPAVERLSVRLLVPGFEGIMSVKWLRRLKLTDRPRDDEGRDVALHDPAERRKGWQFVFPMEVKSADHASGARHVLKCRPGFLRDLRAGVVG